MVSRNSLAEEARGLSLPFPNQCPGQKTDTTYDTLSLKSQRQNGGAMIL
jgi:hypothetical protein